MAITIGSATGTIELLKRAYDKARRGYESARPTIRTCCPRPAVAAGRSANPIAPITEGVAFVARRRTAPVLGTDGGVVDGGLSSPRLS